MVDIYIRVMIFFRLSRVSLFSTFFLFGIHRVICWIFPKVSPTVLAVGIVNANYFIDRRIQQINIVYSETKKM